jgi:hypothetical protein
MLRDRQREERTLWIEFHNFYKPLPMRWISTEILQYFWPTYGQWSRYHISVCQVNTATHAFHCMTEMFLFRKARFQIQRWRFIILNLMAALLLTLLITSLPLPSWHFQLITSYRKRTVIWRVLCVKKRSRH